MTRRFLIDAQLPLALAERLSALGYPSEHVDAIGLSGSTDVEICDYAVTCGAVLMTKDGDFAQLVRQELFPGQIVWIRLGNTRNRILWESLMQVLPEIISGLEGGDRIIEVG
jgi:predicted nuclease of predicted toxin-antitoxin system